MKISIIAAMANNRVIGKDNKMPWHLPEDLKHFKSITMNKPILMGRKTYESIGRALPGRLNIILTRDDTFTADGCVVVSSIEEAFHIVNIHDADELFIIGGENIYSQFMHIADNLYLTLIDLDVEGDTFFPPYMYLPLKEVQREKHDNDTYSYEFVHYEKTLKSSI